MGLTRGNTEIVRIFTGKVLTAGGLNSINEGFPIGEAYRRLILRIYLTIVIGSGAGPISEGELNILKSLTLRTSRGWIPYNNVPGRPLYYIDAYQLSTLPVKTAIAAASAVYGAQYNIWFVDPNALRPEDLVLDTAMFNRLQLDILMGTLADLYTTVGTATLAITADLYAERIRGRLPDKVKPREYREIACPAPVNPANATEINLERAENLAFRKILIQACNSATAGVPFSGTPADTIIAAIGIDSDVGELFNKVNWDVLRGILKGDSEMETIWPGWVAFNFMQDKSKWSSILGGLYSRLRIFWDNGTLSTSQISAVIDGMRKVG